MPKKQKVPKEKSLLATMPWASTNFGSTSEIDAYVEETGTWETIAETHSVAGIFDAEDISNFIVSRVNRSLEERAVLKQALVSLEACLACKNIEQKAKKQANNIIKNIRKIIQTND